MLQYETVFIADPVHTDEEIDELVKGYEQVVTSAKRRLAYTIHHHEEGIYVLMTLECPASLIKELDRRLRMNERIVRHMAVRVESELQLGPSPMMKPRPERDDTLIEPPMAP